MSNVELGTALTDSPSGIAAYVLEKFSAWTNPDFKFLQDGGITKFFTMDELLDNVMMYWINRNNSAITSIRLYAEQANAFNRKLQPERYEIIFSLP